MKTLRQYFLMGAVVLLGTFTTASALSVYYPGENQRMSHPRRGNVVIIKERPRHVIVREPVFERRRDRVVIVKEPALRHHRERVIYVREPVRERRHGRVLIIEGRHHPRMY